MNRPGVWRVAQIALLVVAAGATLSMAAPFINASHWSGAIQIKLESWLGRKVEFRALHFTVFSGPGFLLEDVTIHEDPRYGLEPFAHATALEARLRIDKLLAGQIRFTSLRLVDPSVNVVKRDDGTWNVVELVQRLAAPRRAPLHLFPSFQISGGRVNFKTGTRKSTVYLADTDLSIYPERSGKLYVRFSGSPARTDRAGNGFGHLQGTAHWYLAPASGTANQLEADLRVEPSNLSELTTLVEGYDVGVHGMASSAARIEGPLHALRIHGELRLIDVHRWDLLPASGEEWKIAYQGLADVRAQKLQLETAPAATGETTPAAIELHAENLFGQAQWAVFTRLKDARPKSLLPLARRMGLPIPDDIAADGVMNGIVGYSTGSGLQGRVSIQDLAVTASSLPSLRMREATAEIARNRVHLDPAVVETPLQGTLRAGGDYDLSTQVAVASLTADDLHLAALPSTVRWFEDAPRFFGMFGKGTVTGRITYTYAPKTQPAWFGQLQFRDATLGLPALNAPLEQAAGRIVFDDTDLSLERFSAMVNGEVVRASYRYDSAAKRPEHLRIEMPRAGLHELEAALDPALREQSLLARLRIKQRSIPRWLKERNLEGDFFVAHLSIEGADVGAVTAHATWEGPEVDVDSLEIKLPAGDMRAQGRVDLASYAPQYEFTGNVSGFYWHGGLLSAEGELKTLGIGLAAMKNLQATGKFSARDIQLSSEDAFQEASGSFELSFADGWPRLRVSEIQASNGENVWTGEAATQPDGRLVVDMEHNGEPRRVVSRLSPEVPAPRNASTLTSSSFAQ